MSHIVRFRWWVILFVASGVLLLSLFASLRNLKRDTSDILALSLTGVSVAISFSGMAVSILQQQFESSKKIESVLIFGAVGFWVVSSTIASLAPAYRQEYIEDDPNDIVNPNVFFFAYLCVAASAVLIASWFEEYIQNETSISTTSWVLLGASSFFVMVASIGIRDIRVDDVVDVVNGTTASTVGQNTTGQEIDVNVTILTLLNETINITIEGTSTDGGQGAPITGRTSLCAVTDTISCARIDFAIVLGGVSATCAWVTAPWKNAPLGCMAEVSFLLLIAWVCGVGLLTFGTGPGRSMGTIYFGTWCCVFLCLDILTSASAQLAQRNHRREQQERERAVGRAGESSQPAAPSPTAYQRRHSTERNGIFEVAYGHLERQSRRLSATPMAARGRSASASIFSSIGSWRTDTTRDIPSDPLEGGNTDELSDSTTSLEWDQFRSLELWIALLISSVVCLVAYFPFLPEPSSRSPIEELGLLVPSFGIAASCCGYVASFRSQPKARRAELFWIFLSIATWAVGLPTMFHVEYDDVPSGEETSNGTALANVFFSTWGGFLISLLLATRWFRASTSLTDWVLLGAFSLSLFASSLLFLREETTIPGSDDGEMTVLVCSVLGEDSCSRGRLGMYFGLVSAGISLLMVSWIRAPTAVHVSLGALLFVAWCFAVGLLTYGSGHGIVAGSVYLESWAGLLLSLDITTTNIVVHLRPSESENNPQGGALEDEDEDEEEHEEETENEFIEEALQQLGDSTEQPLKDD